MYSDDSRYDDEFYGGALRREDDFERPIDEYPRERYASRNRVDSLRNRKKTHIHEYQGSVKLQGDGESRHSHRFAGMSSEMIPVKGNHIHKIKVHTDYVNGHFHDIEILSGPAIQVGGEKHVHFISGWTTDAEGHSHIFAFATLIESPLN